MLFETSYFTYSPFGAPLPGRTYNAMEELNKVEIANQEFASGVDGWSTANSNTTVSNDAGRLKLLTTNTSVVSMQKNYVTTSGKHYRISFDADAASYTNVSVDIVGYGSTVLSSAILNTGVIHYQLDFTADDVSSVVRVSLGTGSSTRTIYLDNVKLEEIKGDIEVFAFGFNGKEKDNETYGEGNAVDFGNRVYDARLGRFLSIDRFAKMYPFQSPYCYAANNPIIFLDAGGDSITVSRALWDRGQKVGELSDAEFEAFKTAYITQLQSLTNDELQYRGNVIVIVHLNNMNPGKNLKHGTNLIRQLNRKGPNEKNTTIVKSNINYTHYDNWRLTHLDQITGVPGIGGNSTIEYNPDKNEQAVNVDGTTKRDARFGAAHELIHALHGMLGIRNLTPTDQVDPASKDGKSMTQEEINTRRHENKIRKEHKHIERKVTNDEP